MSKRILIVEDQEDLGGVLRDLLGGSGYAVIEAADGQDGVVQSEIRVPRSHSHGHSASRYRRPQADARHAVSSFVMKGDEEKARAAGCDHCITKPYGPMQLSRTIRGALGEQG
jgi:two-component system cell cycle response regulator DivK